MLEHTVKDVICLLHSKYFQIYDNLKAKVQTLRILASWLVYLTKRMQVKSSLSKNEKKMQPHVTISSHHLITFFLYDSGDLKVKTQLRK